MTVLVNFLHFESSNINVLNFMMIQCNKALTITRDMTSDDVFDRMAFVYLVYVDRYSVTTPILSYKNHLFKNNNKFSNKKFPNIKKFSRKL